MEEVIRGLGSTPYFERVMSLQDVWPQCRQLEIPSHFVQRHADSIQEFTSIQVRGAGREECQQWEIRLRVYWQSGTSHKVKISSDRAWRSFMASSGLQTGDWLIFALTGTSTFDVYMFDNSGNSKVAVSRHQTKNILGNISSSISGEGSRSEIFNARDVEVPLPLIRKPELTEKLMSRVKQFRCILEGTADRAVLSVPLDFVRFYGIGLVDTVTLRGESGRHWLVECSLTILPGVGGRVECTGGWRSFAEDNELRNGDTLLFNLSTQDSFFIVRIPPTSCSGNYNPVAEQTEAAGAPKRKCTRRPSKSLHAVQFSATMTRSSSLGAPYPFLNIPSGFIQHYRSSLAPIVHLRGPKDTEPWAVKFTTAPFHPKGSFSKGWREFIAANRFRLGDEMIFTLSGQSCFTVTRR